MWARVRLHGDAPARVSHFHLNLLLPDRERAAQGRKRGQDRKHSRSCLIHSALICPADSFEMSEQQPRLWGDMKFQQLLFTSLLVSAVWNFPFFSGSLKSGPCMWFGVRSGHDAPYHIKRAPTFYSTSVNDCFKRSHMLQSITGCGWLKKQIDISALFYGYR